MVTNDEHQKDLDRPQWGDANLATMTVIQAQKCANILSRSERKDPQYKEATSAVEEFLRAAANEGRSPGMIQYPTLKDCWERVNQFQWGSPLSGS